jgi:hypothetical protein
VKLNSGLTWQSTIQQVNDSSLANGTCVFKKETIKVLYWNVALYGAETWDTSESRSAIPGSFEMWCWRRMEISWADLVRSEVFRRVKEEKNMTNWIGHVYLRNCLLKQVIVGKMEVSRRMGRKKT